MVVGMGEVVYHPQGMVMAVGVEGVHKVSRACGSKYQEMEGESNLPFKIKMWQGRNQGEYRGSRSGSRAGLRQLLGGIMTSGRLRFIRALGSSWGRSCCPSWYCRCQGWGGPLCPMGAR